MWFTSLVGNSIGRITTSGTFSNYTATGIESPIGLMSGPVGALWFADSVVPGSIGRITVKGKVNI